MTPHEELIELKGIVPEGVWPEGINVDGQSYSGYTVKNLLGQSCVCDVGTQFTLAIVRDAVERWLFTQYETLSIERHERGTTYDFSMKNIHRCDSLPDAVRYVVESGEVGDE